MAEEKWEEIELVKDENGIVPHEALIIALHYHWQEAGGEEDIHGLIDRLHTHGALDRYQECHYGGDPVLSNGQLVNDVEAIIGCLKHCRLDRQEASRRFMELSRLCKESSFSHEKLTHLFGETGSLAKELSHIRQEVVDKLVELSRF